ncbi:MAG TPA: laccase domain-containing protein, partial [Burkholderiales bacterium]|nr:laccase domain-containing protein [Burkholderiales bacterium]
MKTIAPAWSAPKNVKAVTTTRVGGASKGVYAGFNLGEHVGDDLVAVRANRKFLREALGLSREPLWLKQVHGISVVDAAACTDVTADGAWTDARGTALVIMTADCMPIFLSDRRGTKIALVHAGWRGLAAGVVEAGVGALKTVGAEVIAHLGPGIGRDAYEVGHDVRDTFIAKNPDAVRAFRETGQGKWLADMYELA